MKEKDPYLDELDEIEDLGDSPDETGAGEEPTRVDYEVGSETAGEEVKSPKEAPAARELIGLGSDIPVQLVVVMGKKSVTVKDLLGLRMGQVIDMDKVPTEPVDLVAGGKIIAKGELVEVDGKLGVRILKLLK